MPKQKRKPSYLLHKPSNRGRVRVKGKDIYFTGPYGSQESLDEYDDFCRDWLLKQEVGSYRLTIDELCLLYLRHAEAYYQKDGERTAEVACIKAALRLLCRFAGRTRAREFGPLQFRQFRDSLITEPDRRLKNGKRTLSRQYINKVLRKVVRAFKWAAGEEHIPVSCWQALTTVEGLKKGRSKARETRKVQPVDDSDVDAVLPHLAPPVAAMIELQRLTGMRPGEVVELRPCDITHRIDGLWVFRPRSFKTEHHEDAERIIFIGPKGQKVLGPWLDRDPEAFCFSPREATAWRNEQKRAKRKTKVQPSQIDRSKPNPKRQPGEKYTEESYRRAIHYGCGKAGIAKWGPNRIRHAVGTVVREKFGLEASQVVLGHAQADVTQIYAARDQKEAARVMKEIG